MIVQGISTKYVGPSNTRGARIKASAWAGSVTVHWDHALNSEQNHAAAARALCIKYGWTGRYIQGGDPSGDGYLFVYEGGDAFTLGRENT